MDQRISELADYVLAFRYEDIPREVVHEAKRKMIDALACAMGAYNEDAARIARAIAGRSVSDPPAHVLGTLAATTAEYAAFANGTMVRCDDYNDTSFAQSAGHPSDFLGAVLGLGEIIHADGRAIVTALTLAYEPYYNLSEVLPREQGWDYPLHTVVGTVAACAPLLKLSRTQFEHAVALAITPNLPLEQTRLGELSMWKGAAGAYAAKNGVLAAQLAAEGFTGPDQAITGRWGLAHKVGAFQWAPFGGRGGPFRITRTHLEDYPAVIHAQSPITAALALRKEVAPADIASITVETYWVAQRYTDRDSPLWHPTTRETADHSLAYIIAVALLDGDVNGQSYGDDRIRDPRVHELLGKMSLHERPDFSARFPDAWPCRIDVVTKSGERKSASADYFLGHVKNPLSDAQVALKFRRLAAGKLAAKNIDAILEMLWNVEELTDIGKLIMLFDARVTV